jgi:hypothetical protein
MSVNFREWKTSEHLIHALHPGALAWIEQREPPSLVSVTAYLISRAYIEQTSLGRNVLFRGFWSISWRRAQEYEFAASLLKLDFKDNGEDWASQAQLWMFDMFDLVWGLRIGSILLERNYRLMSDIPSWIRLLPFSQNLSVSAQEHWISKAEEFLPLARKRLQNLANKGQHSITEFIGRRHSF